VTKGTAVVKDQGPIKPSSHWVISGLLFSALLALVGADRSLQQSLDTSLRPYLQNGAVVVADQEKIIYRCGGEELLVPASTLKLATALAAMHYLGSDYRWKTLFYINHNHDLTIRGTGDPFLISEEWELIVQELKDTEALPGTINDLCLDPGAFSPEIRVPGVENSLEPHHALNSALAVNFNTINIEVDKNGTIRSAEPQTPLTPLARRLSRELPPGQHRINISRQPEVVLPYVGELARAFLEKQECPVSGTVLVRPVSASDRLILTHLNSHSLEHVIQAMMRYSNNYIANQLLLTIGLEYKGEPATLEKGLASLREYLTGKMGIPTSDFHLAEGSGISRENRLRPRALIELLRAFYPYRTLLPASDRALVKTGTLRGVYTMAGYTDTDPPLCFAIMLNQKKNYRRQVLSTLLRELASFGQGAQESIDSDTDTDSDSDPWK